MIGLRIIRDGDRVAVWDATGHLRNVDGPRRLWLFRETVEPLHRFSAEAEEFLVVRQRNGVARHLRGPCDLWFDPVEHEHIEVRPLLPIDANEALVVYRRDEPDAVTRRVLRGPAQYMPEPEEWLHDFVWHGADKKNPRRKVPYALKFSRLRVIPDQTYVDVTDVRTVDDALLTVQTMIFFELVDIERMLDQTHDPIADFINAVTADIIDFAAGRSFDTFKRDTEKLSDLDSYGNLSARAERVGYRINKVVYRGYEANPKLQAMHDDAIEARTGLQLQAETERQAQELADLKLTREADRSRQQRAIEREQTEHEQQLKQLNHRETLRQQVEEHDQAVTFKRELDGMELEHQKAMNAEQAAYLKSMQDMQVDLTRYLVAQYQHPDRLIRIDGGSADPARLHLHS
ncbi:MAG: hypothetical protein CMJ18_20585 [Phycisphaeraceae bacterium]|nr:hypothetical protein [Phycisphaeraceae bacterium]